MSTSTTKPTSACARITADGLIHTIAGNGSFRLSGNGGPAASATVDYPLSATEDGAGNIYISEPLQNRIRRIAPDGTISLYAGTGNQGFTADGKLASTASLAYPGFLAVTPREQYLVFAEEYNCRARYIDHSGILNTYAGGAGCVDTGDGGLATKAGLRDPMAVDVDSFGDIFIKRASGEPHPGGGGPGRKNRDAGGRWKSRLYGG